MLKIILVTIRDIEPHFSSLLFTLQFYVLYILSVDGFKEKVISSILLIAFDGIHKIMY